MARSHHQRLFENARHADENIGRHGKATKINAAFEKDVFELAQNIGCGISQLSKDKPMQIRMTTKANYIATTFGCN